MLQLSDNLAVELPGYSGAEATFVGVGVILLLFGWLVFRAGTRVLGMALGVGLGFFVGEVLNVVLKIDRESGLLLTLACCAIGGIAALFMLRAVTNFLFALIGLLFGALLGRLGAEVYASMQGHEFVFSQESGVVILGVAVATALVAVWLQRLIMILTTSYMGATFLVAGVPGLVTYPWSFPAVLVAGILWQGSIMGRIFSTRKRRRKPDNASDQGR